MQVVEEASKRTFWIRVKQATNKLEESSPPPQPPQITDDKLQSLKRIVFVVVNDINIVLQGMNQVLSSSNVPQEIIQLGNTSFPKFLLVG